MKTFVKFIVCFLWPFYIIDKYPPLKWVCWFSSKFWDIHDYQIKMGGDGWPSHFYTYKCSRCKKEFTI